MGEPRIAGMYGWDSIVNGHFLILPLGPHATSQPKCLLRLEAAAHGTEAVPKRTMATLQVKAPA